jgi:nucleotide-binding universal stress UspA family protein
MKKIIAAFDGLKYSTSTRDHALALAKQTGIHLCGYFMDDPVYNSFSLYDVVVNQQADEHLLDKYRQADDRLRQVSALNFETNCIQQNLAYTIHCDKNIAHQQIVHESIYGYLLLICKTESLSRYPEKTPTRFVRELLENTCCPVLLVPESYTPIQKIVLLYDGAPASVFAIKMFSYILPEYMLLETEIISVSGTDNMEHTPDDKLMREFLTQHYPTAKRTILSGNPEVVIPQYMKQQPPGTMAVLGSYARGNVSRWFRQSMADVLMKETDIPMFVAHG